MKLPHVVQTAGWVAGAIFHRGVLPLPGLGDLARIGILLGDEGWPGHDDEPIADATDVEKIRNMTAHLIDQDLSEMSLIHQIDVKILFLNKQERLYREFVLRRIQR